MHASDIEIVITGPGIVRPGGPVAMNLLSLDVAMGCLKYGRWIPRRLAQFGSGRLVWHRLGS
jgi:hypothetical protein